MTRTVNTACVAATFENLRHTADIRPVEAWVLITLASIADDDWIAQVSFDELAALCFSTPRTVATAVKTLNNKDLIDITTRPSKPTVYLIGGARV